MEMKDLVKKIANDQLAQGEVIALLRDWSKDSVRNLLDDMVATAVVMQMPDFYVAGCDLQGKRLAQMVNAVASELLPEYDKLRKPTAPLEPNNPELIARLYDIIDRNNLIIEDLINQQEEKLQSKNKKSVLNKQKRETAAANEFRSCLLVSTDKQEELLKKLHQLIDGKKGKPVALVIHLCVEFGLMSKPTFGVLKSEFGDIGNPSGYNDYYRHYSTKYTDDEIKGVIAHLKPFMNLN